MRAFLGAAAAWVCSWRITHWLRRGHYTTTDCYRMLSKAAVIRRRVDE